MATTGDVFSKLASGPVDLERFQEELALEVQIPALGQWLLFGRVTVGNDDSDAQNATVRLRDDEGILDQVDIRLSGDSLVEAVPLQANRRFGENARVFISCSTFKGAARQISLMGMLAADDLSDDV
jgi:hypothetical protein